MRDPIVTKEWFGTTLKNGIDALNAEPEHRRIGLVWMLQTGSLWVKEDPSPRANFANGLGICEEIAKHLKTGGMDIRWPYKKGYTDYMVTPDGVSESDYWA